MVFWYPSTCASTGLSKHGSPCDHRFADFQDACARGGGRCRVSGYRIQARGLGKTRGSCDVSCNNACEICKTGCELLVSLHSRILSTMADLVLREVSSPFHKVPVCAEPGWEWKSWRSANHRPRGYRVPKGPRRGPKEYVVAPCKFIDDQNACNLTPGCEWKRCRQANHRPRCYRGSKGNEKRSKAPGKVDTMKDCAAKCTNLHRKNTQNALSNEHLVFEPYLFWNVRVHWTSGGGVVSHVGKGLCVPCLTER